MMSLWKKFFMMMFMMMVVAAAIFAEKYNITVTLAVDKTIKLTEEDLADYKSMFYESISYKELRAAAKDIDKELKNHGWGGVKESWSKFVTIIDNNREDPFVYWLMFGKTKTNDDFSILCDNHNGEDRIVYESTSLVNMMTFMLDNGYYTTNDQNVYEIAEISFN